MKTLIILLALTLGAVSAFADSAITKKSGESVTFSVAVAPPDVTLPLAYQWRKNGLSITGATAPTYVIPSAKVSDSGGYSVLVRNDGGTVLSDTATLTVLAPPVPPTTATVTAK